MLSHHQLLNRPNPADFAWGFRLRVQWNGKLRISRRTNNGGGELEMDFLVIENLERCEDVNVKQRYMGVSKNRGTSKSSILNHFNRVFPFKPSILGYHYFWKHPYSDLSSCVYE